MNFNKNVLFSLFLALFGTTPHNISPLSPAEKMAIGAGVTITTLSASHAYGFIRNYLIKKTLQGGLNKHTWNFLEEYFPSKYEMDAAEGDFHLLVQKNVKTFKTNQKVIRVANPLYLLSFVEEAEKDLVKLQSYKNRLTGDPSSRSSMIGKAIANATLFRGLRSHIDELYREVHRYEKRLIQIIHSIVNSYEYAVQLQMKAQKEIAHDIASRA